MVVIPGPAFCLRRPLSERPWGGSGLSARRSGDPVLSNQKSESGRLSKGSGRISGFGFAKSG